MSTFRSKPLPVPLRRFLRVVLDPTRRYRHAKLIHAARVAAAMLASIALTTGLNLPHGEWASITCLVVIGGLQHHGNIRKKATERALGTTIGAVAGLLLIAEQSWLSSNLLTYLLMALGCGFFAYHAIGRGGYTALLSAITMVIVAGHGGTGIADGLWRTVDVMVGIGIALLFSFALPLYATYSWRYGMADALRGCARAHLRILRGIPPGGGERGHPTAKLGTLLVQLRSLMPSVAKEINVSTAQLEAIQGSLRICISTLELLWALQPEPIDDAWRQAANAPLSGETRRIGEMLVGMARALKFGTLARLRAYPAVAPLPTEATLEARFQAYSLLTHQLLHEVDRMRGHLAAISMRWNVGPW